MLAVATVIDLGTKPSPLLVPRRPLTDEKMSPKCFMEKSPLPDRAIERTNRLQDCQYGAHWCPKSPQNVSESYTKRQPYRFKNHACSHHYCFDFANSFYRFICRATRSNFIHSIHSFIAQPNFKKNVFVAARASKQTHFSRCGAFL